MPLKERIVKLRDWLEDFLTEPVNPTPEPRFVWPHVKFAVARTLAEIEEDRDRYRAQGKEDEFRKKLKSFVESDELSEEVRYLLKKGLTDRKYF